MTDDRGGLSAARGETIRGPTLRTAALATIVGYLLSFGTPFASFSVLPKVFAPNSAAQTSQNVAANERLFVAAIFAMLLNFVGDVLGAWGLYVLLRPVNARWSLLAAWFRLVYTAVGIAAVLNLVTAHHLLTDPDDLAALGRGALDAHVYVALGSFQVQFAFSLILFGLYMTMVGWLVYQSVHLPKWLGVVLAIDGVGWMVSEAGPYLFPGVNFGFLFVTSFGELVFLIWLIGWGLRLKEARSA
jgi:hypothetical protein